MIGVPAALLPLFDKTTHPPFTKSREKRQNVFRPFPLHAVAWQTCMLHQSTKFFAENIFLNFPCHYDVINVGKLVRNWILAGKRYFRSEFFNETRIILSVSVRST